MRRSKRNAAVFLAGAVLVGGVTGAAGNVWYSQYGQMHGPYHGPGDKFFEVIGLSCDQRQQMDSILFATSAKAQAANVPFRTRYDSVMKPAHLKADSILAAGKPIVDSIWKAGQAQVRAVMTAKQQTRFDELRAAADKQGPPDQKNGACGGNWFPGRGGDGHHAGPGGPDGRSGGGGPHGPDGPPDHPRRFP